MRRKKMNKKRKDIAEQIIELGKNHIYLVDVWGGKMWYNEETKQYSWDVNEFIKGYSRLNELAVCYGN